MSPDIIRKVQVIVFCRAPEIHVLLLQRPAERGHIWQPITGKVDPEDAHLMQSAHRELEEETGITDALHFIETGVEFHFNKGTSEVQERLFGAEVERFHSIRLSSEHVAYAWLSPWEASSRMAWDTNREGLEIVLASAT